MDSLSRLKQDKMASLSRLKKRGIDIRGTVLNADDLVDEVIRNI